MVGSSSNSNSKRDAASNDRFLPIANVSRIMKRALPINAKISKEAKETIQECVSEYVSFISVKRLKSVTVRNVKLSTGMTFFGP
ncbi:Nuclear transcription factor Y subunit B-3 [Zostera marina]|uniref:Nuclear transcription factor Y subunit B-3 n=1 Tax=Zostera marina TaxID=29655 RepID=A0A0K9NVD7_ZOSMR|nr:Nuclear transcription factor Y subunit B-3 [Zostera marina]